MQINIKEFYFLCVRKYYQKKYLIFTVGTVTINYFVEPRVTDITIGNDVISLRNLECSRHFMNDK